MISVTLYRGQRIVQDKTKPLNTKGRFCWGVRVFAQLNHVKSAIDDHLSRAAL